MVTHVYGRFVSMTYKVIHAHIAFHTSFLLVCLHFCEIAYLFGLKHVRKVNEKSKLVLFSVFLAFDFCRFCVVIRFFHPLHNGQWPPTSKDFYTKYYPLHYCLILILEKSQYFPFSMLSAKQGYYWYHFYNVFGMTRSLTGDWNRDLPHSKPALYH